MEVIGTINGLYATYQVMWDHNDSAMITDCGDEVVTFCSAQENGFKDSEDVLSQAQDVVVDIESDLGWDEDED